MVILEYPHKFLYIDACALSRPYDDQSFMRIRLETASMDLIMSNVKAGAYAMYYSPVHKKELSEISYSVEREELLQTMKDFAKPISKRVNKTNVRERATHLVATYGVGLADAAHTAYAEALAATFITCDDKLIRKCKRAELKIWYGTPTDFCAMEGLK